MSRARYKQYPALAKRGDGAVRFSLPMIPEGPASKRVIAMDYNLFVRHSGGFERDDADGSFEERTYRAFMAALRDVCRELAHLVVRDGEGAQKFIEIAVTGAASDESARHVGLAIANSPLVKTAIAGGNANWGRVVMAVGKAGEPADRDRLSIGFGGTWAARDGQPLADYDERPVTEHLAGEEIRIDVDLGMGDGRATVWTCDLTHGYISINADYRS